MSSRRKIRRGRNQSPKARSAEPWWVRAPVLTPDRPPWNKGKRLSETPSASTDRRTMLAMEAMGIVEHATEHTGKPGRPAWRWSLTEDGLKLQDASQALQVLLLLGADISCLPREQADVLIRFGYAVREGDRLVHLEDYQAHWKYRYGREAAS